MKTRYGIAAKDAFGVPMAAMQGLATKLGRNQALAETLWATGNYEARTVAALIAEPERVTPPLMDRWCRDFDNWAIELARKLAASDHATRRWIGKDALRALTKTAAKTKTSGEARNRRDR